MQTHSNKTPHEQGAEATSTYQAYGGGELQPYPEPNNVAIENHHQQQHSSQQQQKLSHQQQSHFDKSLRSNSNNPPLQQQSTKGQKSSATVPHLDSLKNTDFLTSDTKTSITATTAARRYSRFENPEALERRVSTASSGSGSGGVGGGSRSLAASALADIITADVGGASTQRQQQLQQQQHTFGSRTYGDGRVKRASIYGTDISGKLTASSSGIGSSRESISNLTKRHSGSFTNAFELASIRGQTGE